MVDNIRVFNIASNDYANMSHNNANALRSIGVYCNDYALSIHPFGYTSQSRAVSKEFHYAFTSICSNPKSAHT